MPLPWSRTHSPTVRVPDRIALPSSIVDPAGEIPYILVVLTKGLRNEGAGNAGIAAISRRVYTRLHAAS